MRRALTEQELRKLLLEDSIERRRWLSQLLQIVRADERDKVLNTMARKREHGERGETP